MLHVINVDDLLKEVSAENPGGENLEYDPDFLAMEQASRGKGEQQVGDSVIPAQDADWRTVKSKAIDLLKRSKDLRVAVYLTRALVPVDGLIGLQDGLNLVEGLLERHWGELHPKLDPDDGNDPTIRVNTLQNLYGHETMLCQIQAVELVSAKGIGRFSLRDFLIAVGKLPAPGVADTPPAGLPEIEAAFMDCSLEELQAKDEAVKGSIDLVKSIESTLMSKVGPAQTVGFSPLTNVLKELSGILSAQLKRRGVGVPGVEAGGGAGQAGQPLTGAVNTREDVVRVLDMVCEYFRRSEPSSPVPLLLRRAKKLVSKEFLEIVRDLAPSGVQEVEKIRGPESK